MGDGLLDMLLLMLDSCIPCETMFWNVVFSYLRGGLLFVTSCRVSSSSQSHVDHLFYNAGHCFVWLD